MLPLTPAACGKFVCVMLVTTEIGLLCRKERFCAPLYNLLVYKARGAHSACACKYGKCMLVFLFEVSWLKNVQFEEFQVIEALRQVFLFNLQADNIIVWPRLL